MAWTASYMATWTIATSTMVDGPRSGVDAVQSVFAAISCQSVTASARATSVQPNAPIKAAVPAATHLFQLQRVVMTCISFLPVWVERLRFTLRHEDDRASRHGGRRAARERGVERAHPCSRGRSNSCCARDCR